MNKTKIVKVKLGKQKNDFLFWLSQHVHKRLEALEQLRKQYII